LPDALLDATIDLRYIVCQLTSNLFVHYLLGNYLLVHYEVHYLVVHYQLIS